MGTRGPKSSEAATAPSWRSALSLSDMQTPLQAPICLHGHNQETRDTAKLWSVDFPPPGLERRLGGGGGARGRGRSRSRSRETTDLKKQGANTKGDWPHFATLRKGAASPSNKGGGGSLARIRHGRSPADTLLTRGHRWLSEGHNPWELPTPRRRARPPARPPAWNTLSARGRADALSLGRRGREEADVEQKQGGRGFAVRWKSWKLED